MSFSHDFTEAILSGGTSLNKTNTFTGDGRLSIEASVATGEENFEIDCVLDVSELSSLYIVSDQDVTFETNDGAAPPETIALLADVPYIWTSSSYHTNLLETDITALFISNTSGETAIVNIEFLYDCTDITE